MLIIAAAVVLFVKKKRECNTEENRSKTMKVEANEDYGTYTMRADSVTEVSTSNS